MAHEIENRNGKDSFAYVGAKGWHSLGQEVTGDACYDYLQFAEAANANYGVYKTPLYRKDENGDFVPTADSYGVMRDVDSKYLGTVGTQWEPVQPLEAIKWFQPWVDERLARFETAGVLKDGKVIFALCKILQEDEEVIKNDSISRYVLLSTSFDGTQATRCGFTNIRVVCANTLAMAHDKNASDTQLIRIRHHKNQGTVLAKIRDIMSLANNEFQATMEQYRFLAKSKIVNHNDLVQYVIKVLDVDLDADGNFQSTRTKNRVQEICDLAYIGTGADLAAGTWWSAYNAVTEYLSHKAGRNPDNRYTSLWLGQNFNLNQRALDLAVQVAN